MNIEGEIPKKKKIEVRFSEIESIDINIEKSFIKIGKIIKNLFIIFFLLLETKKKPIEYKEHNPQPKKNTQWVRQDKLISRITFYLKKKL